MDPFVISLLITSITTLLFNVFQSFMSRHFESQCCDCFSVKYDGGKQPDNK